MFHKNIPVNQTQSNTTDSYTSDSANLTSMSLITSDLQSCAVVILHVEIRALYVQSNMPGGLLVLVSEDTEVLRDSGWMFWISVRLQIENGTNQTPS